METVVGGGGLDIYWDCLRLAIFVLPVCKTTQNSWQGDLLTPNSGEHMPLTQFEIQTLIDKFNGQADEEYVSLTGLTDDLLPSTDAEDADGNPKSAEARRDDARNWSRRIGDIVAAEVGYELHPELRIRKPRPCATCGQNIFVGRSNAYIFEPEEQH